MTENGHNENAVTFTPTTVPGVTPVDPLPAHQDIPPWFENLGPDADGIKSFRHSSVKLCMPFNDALGTGWVLKAPETVELHSPSNGDTCRISTPTGDTPGSQVALPLPTSQPAREGNSVFSTPDCILRTGWEIETPPGVSLLFLPPMNRPSPKVKPVGFLAETDSYSDEIHIPLVLQQEAVTLHEGETIAQVVPIVRDDLLDPADIRSFDESSRFAQFIDRLNKLTGARSGFYRRELWVNKTSTRVYTDKADLNRAVTEDRERATPANTTDNSSFSPPKVREFLGEGTDQAFYCEEKFEGAVPQPVPAGEYIPDSYFEELRNAFPPGMEYPLTSWIHDAMTLGYIFPLGIEIQITRDDQGHLHAESPGDDRFHILDARKLGDEHPFAPLTPINLIGHWSPVLQHGYSNLYTQPINHFQQDYQAFSGIVDSDRHISTVNIPGRIPRDRSNVVLTPGMPVTQAIPMKRNSTIHVAYVNRTESSTDE